MVVLRGKARYQHHGHSAQYNDFKLAVIFILWEKVVVNKDLDVEIFTIYVKEELIVQEIEEAWSFREYLNLNTFNY